MSKGESLKHKLTKPSTFRKFNQVEKACILGIVLISGFFAVSFSYYANVVLPSERPDPYTTLWNGQASIASAAISIFANSSNTCATSPCSVTVTPSTGKLITVEFITGTFATLGSCPSVTVSDSQANTYTPTCLNQAFSGSYTINQFLYYATASASSADTITVTYSSAEAIIMSVQVWNGATTIGFTANAKNTFSGAITTTLNGFTTQFTVIDFLANGNLLSGCPGLAVTTGSGQQSVNYQFCVHDISGGDHLYQLYVYTGSGQTSYSLSWGAFTAGGYIHAAFTLSAPGSSLCPTSYICGAHSQQVTDNGGSIQLIPNATFPGVALSASAIDLSNTASKALAMSIFSTLPGSGSYVASEQTAWYLTTNSTLPNQANYNPLNDQSVVLIVYQFVTSPGVSSNYYVYIQRQVGQTLNVGSVNPGTSNCNFGSTLFICGAFSIPSNTNSNIQSLVLNFTGAANNNGGTNNQAGQSYFCGGAINFGIHTCNLGGYAQTAISFMAQVVNQTLLPWLSIQNSYHVGFWEAAGGNPYDYIINIGSNSPIFSVYTPPASSLNPNLDIGAYFGWIGRSLGGAFNAVSNFVSPAISFLSSAGNSLLNVFISGFVQGVSIMLQAYRITLNFIGGLFGMGNLGDILVNTLIAVGSLIVNGFSAIVSFFTGLGSIITSGYFTFLAGAATLIAVLLPVAIILWNVIFNAAFTVNDLLFIDYVIGMLMVAAATRKRRGALKAFMGWVSLNKFFFTFIFNAAWVIFDIVTRPIHRTKETVDPVG